MPYFSSAGSSGLDTRKLFDGLRSAIQGGTQNDSSLREMIGKAGALSNKERNDLLNLLAVRQRGPGGGGTPFVPPGAYAPGAGGPGMGGPGGPGGGGGPGQGNVYQQLLDSYTKAQADAKAANEARYTEGMAGYQARYDQAMKDLQGAGVQQQSDISARANERMKDIGQGMVSSGLYGTTAGIAPKIAAGREEEAQINRLQESIRQQKLQYGAQLYGDKLGFLERREDEYPNMNAYLQVMQGLGQSGYGNFGYTPAQGGAPNATVGPTNPIAGGISPGRPVPKPGLASGYGNRPGVPVTPMARPPVAGGGRPSPAQKRRVTQVNGQWTVG